MDQIIQTTARDYRIHVEPIIGQAVALNEERAIARSSAAKALYETRLPVVVYFPREDLGVRLHLNPEYRTFCPFKGTATYYDVEIDGTIVQNAAWSYENALPEAAEIQGYVAFASSIAQKLDFERHLDSGTDGNISGPIVDWLLREAVFCKTPEDLTRTVAERLQAEGIAVSRMSVLVWSLHPLIAGRNYVWTRESGEVKSNAASYEVLERPEFANSPLRHVAHGLGGVRQRLDSDSGEFSFPIMDDLKAAGATDYVAMPLRFSDGRINVLTMASDHPGGFTTANLGLVFECSFILARLYEGFAMRENFTTLLDTYLGKRTGARVLAGEIRRGDGDEIEAAILFCDMRDSTRLEASLPRAEYLDVLNRFFESTTEIIVARGGEVLKYIGDAVLAVFPAGDDPGLSCQNASDAAREIVSRLGDQNSSENPYSIDCAIGIAFGNVTYGNVGSPERLDFTVIGGAANVAARLSEVGKRQAHRIMVTRDIASSTSLPVKPLGDFELYGVSPAVDVYAIT